jgi:hypothetical protein
LLGSLHGEDEEIEELKAKLLVRWSREQCSGGGARRWQSSNGASLVSSAARARERRGQRERKRGN